jgi:hypothetical protein
MIPKTRLEKLERTQRTDNENILIVDWGGDTVNVKGEELPRAEFERRYPDCKVIEWATAEGERI